MRVIEGLYDGVTTSELDNLAAEIAATMTTTHPDYASLAAEFLSLTYINTTNLFIHYEGSTEYVNPITEKSSSSFR